MKVTDTKRSFPMAQSAPAHTSTMSQEAPKRIHWKILVKKHYLEKKMQVQKNTLCVGLGPPNFGCSLNSRFS